VRTTIFSCAIKTSRAFHFAYHSECGDHRAHERHWVEVQRWRQAGQTPPVSNVFHEWPQEQDHWSSLRGDQPQSGHRIRGTEGSWLFSSTSSWSKTTDDPSRRVVGIFVIITHV